MTVNISNPQDLQGATVVGNDGEKLGKVEEIYLDNESGAPEWASVKTGFFGGNTALVPLSAATLTGDSLSVPFSKDKVKGAPHNEPGHEISVTDEQELYAYYGVSYGGGDVVTDAPVTTGYTDTTPTDTVTTDTTTAGTTTGYDTTSSTGTVGHDTSGPTETSNPADDTMTRSEEQLHVGTESREAGKARLRKYITSETVTQTVPVSHEEVHVEREAITDANRDAALTGGDLTEEVHEVTLHEEVPVSVKETVPVERVRLGTETVTEQATVSDEVRKEHIEVDGVEGDTVRPDER